MTAKETFQSWAMMLKLLILFHWIKDSEDLNEQINHVQVKVDWGQDVLLGGKLVHQHVGVEYNECRKQQGTGYGIHQLKCLTVEEELKDNNTRIKILASCRVWWKLIFQHGLCHQHAQKVLSDSSGLLDFSVSLGLMVSVLDSRSSSPCSSPGHEHCVVFLGKTLNCYTCSVSLHHGV